MELTLLEKMCKDIKSEHSGPEDQLPSNVFK